MSNESDAIKEISHLPEWISYLHSHVWILLLDTLLESYLDTFCISNHHIRRNLSKITSHYLSVSPNVQLVLTILTYTTFYIANIWKHYFILLGKDSWQVRRVETFMSKSRSSKTNWCLVLLLLFKYSSILST